jgi:hypothetical protein
MLKMTGDLLGFPLKTTVLTGSVTFLELPPSDKWPTFWEPQQKYGRSVV